MSGTALCEVPTTYAEVGLGGVWLSGRVLRSVDLPGSVAGRIGEIVSLIFI